jgi:hypothetical protein
MTREEQLDEALSVADGILSTLLKERDAIPTEVIGGIVTGVVLAHVRDAALDEIKAAAKRAVEDLEIRPFQKLNLRRRRKAPRDR